MLLNSFVITIFALALAALASNFVNSSNAQNAAANIMTLALCFLGGVFVPRYMLSDGILAVSQFLPTYWNVIALERATELTSFDTSAMAPFWQAVMIQLTFAAAVFCLSLLVGKHINQSERFVNSVRTELEG
jgi:ABC-type multidrug transport system permease subunit